MRRADDSPARACYAERMDMSRMRAALTDPRGLFPREAMEWARGNTAQATPALLAMLTACTRPGDLSDREMSGAFFALPMLAELREPRAWPLVCALARNGDRLDEIFGDFGADYLHRLLVAVYDGDSQGLFAIAADAAVDPIIRGSFLLAWRWDVLQHRVDRAKAFDAVLGLDTTIGDDEMNDPLWFEWAQALIMLDPDAAMPLVRAALDNGDTDEAASAAQGYEDDAASWRADPEGQRETFLTENAPPDDAIGTILRWEQSVEEAEAEYEGEERDRSDAGDAPLVNQFRDVGRNDPCPCGSGKKFKKCCLAA